MIAIVDYGMGNLRSVQKAFEAVGVKAELTRDPDRLIKASSVVLPGVGAFKDCMTNLERFSLMPAVLETIKIGKPFLGICLGLQLLFEESEEFGPVKGLGVLPGKVVKFSSSMSDKDGNKLKVPHMGWNQVYQKKTSKLFKGIPDESYFYFVHSYYVVSQEKNPILTVTDYGQEFTSSIEHENIHAFQFHPEKSQKLGLTLLENFSKL